MPELTRKTVMVVDDNDFLLSVNRAVLESDGYEVVTAQSGAEALAVLSQIPRPDLILLDMMMGDMNGADFLRTLEAKQPQIVANVPVVFLSGVEKVPPSKAVGFLKKPVDLDDLLTAVRRFIAAGVGHAA